MNDDELEGNGRCMIQLLCRNFPVSTDEPYDNKCLVPDLNQALPKRKALPLGQPVRCTVFTTWFLVRCALLKASRRAVNDFHGKWFCRIHTGAGMLELCPYLLNRRQQQPIASRVTLTWASRGKVVELLISVVLHVVAWLLETLCYKPEGRGLDCRCGDCIFQLT
jgi:hypothetical protein